MAYLHFHNVGISAVSACVPRNVVDNSHFSGLMPEDEMKKVEDSIGVKERRFADKDVCASDLCLNAALKLFEDGSIVPGDVSALIFVSQTPDYHQPSTAPMLQERLKLPKTTMCFDINLACSGFVYGLSVAFSLASQEGFGKVLLLVGETMSKIVSMKDKVSAPLFGDAGTATLIEKMDVGDTYFSLNSDGSGSDVIKMPFGGYRNQSSPEGLMEKRDAEGNIRSGEQFFMDGMAVFNFGMKVEPTDIKDLLGRTGLAVNDIDLLIYHQANRFMTDFFSRWLKVPKEKTPYSIDRFGNTSSASIPLTIVTEMNDPERYPNRDKVVMSGFGAGLSWGSALTSLSRTKVSRLIEI